ncbi:sensor histidine kinase [Chryseobacterium sp. FH1]|uniref:tetratricopeptide repeat-containing sensor histidine kinase n=1 Tax=Chryseobacterium sp. FH1 TaxID=1233951 RepID=UPI0004E3F07D|nr:HAMP domain-containing sensor histidine kinase [Chryseobacterium sp. FH1]KFC18866.1 hypothetical protein IO90_17960 [Chryseobacterium sp. FH1]
MKNIFLLVAICYISKNYAQQKQGQDLVDSLLLELPKAKQDSSKVNLLNAIAGEYTNLYNEKGKKYAQQSTALSKKINFKSGEADSYEIIGKFYSMEPDFKRAIKYYNNAIKIGISQNDSKRLSKLYKKMGNIYQDNNNYSSALEYYFKSAKIDEELHNINELGKDYVYIAEIYRGVNDFKKSKYYLDISTKNALKAGDKKLLTYIYLSYAHLYENQNQTDKVEFYARKAYLLAKEIDNKNYIGTSLFALGLVDEKKGNYEQAILKINETLKISTEQENIMGMANAQNELGLCYYKMYEKTKNSSHLRLSKENFEKSNKLYLENELIDGVPDNYLYLSKIDEEEKKFRSGLENYKLYSKYKDSILNTATKESIKNLEDQRTIDLKNKQIQINKLQIEAKEKQKWYFIAGLGLLGIIGGLLFYQSRNRKKSNEKLQVLNQDLEKANKTKMQFFGILNHDLRSPVVSLIHFLDLQKNAPDLIDDETKIRLEKQTSDSADQLLTQMEDLLLWSKGQMENFQPDKKFYQIKDIFSEIEKEFVSASDIDMRFDIHSDFQIFTDKEYLKTIIRNLMSNAVKVLHDVPNPKIICKAWEENQKRLILINDNGGGTDIDKFRALYDDKTSIGTTKGLGLHVIRDLCKAIDCKIEVDSDKTLGETKIMLCITKA